MNILNYLKKQSTIVKILVGLLLVLIAGIADYLIGLEISIAIIYLIPVLLTTWLTNRWVGFLISFASAIAWLIAEITTKDNYIHPLIPYWNAAVKLGFFLITAHFFSSWKKALEQAEKLANTDELTGVFNRRYFFILANTELNRFCRYQRPLTIAYIDIDNFKKVNDTFGHSTGDALIRLVAQVIRRNIRVTDVIARLGGDEFVLLLSETGCEASHAVIRRVQQHLLDTMQQHEWPVTFSIGAVTFLKPPNSVDEMIEKADALMYRVKNHGKNRVEHKTVG